MATYVIMNQAIQTFGAHGYPRSIHVERHLCGARFGAPHVQRSIIADSLLWRAER